MTAYQFGESKASVNITVDLSAPVEATNIVPEKSPNEYSKDQLGSSLGFFKGLTSQEDAEDRQQEDPCTPDEDHRVMLGKENSCDKLDDTSRDEERDKAAKDVIRDISKRAQEKEEVTWAAEAHEEIWRKNMFKELEVQDPSYRKTISQALYNLRLTPQWLHWSGEEKIRESEITVARINSYRSSKTHRESDANKKTTHNRSPRPAKRNRSSLDSSIGRSRSNTLFEQDSTNFPLYSSPGVLESCEEIPIESGLRESGLAIIKEGRTLE